MNGRRGQQQRLRSVKWNPSSALDSDGRISLGQAEQMCLPIFLIIPYFVAGAIVDGHSDFSAPMLYPG